MRDGKAVAPLAMDTLEVTGMVMTSSLNAIITDSSPGMAAYSTGQKNNNNQEGVFPDNTRDTQDNPRIEYIGELLRRTRGAGFNVGIVTTADVTDSTPGANGAHTSDRYASAVELRAALLARPATDWSPAVARAWWDRYRATLQQVGNASDGATLTLPVDLEHHRDTFRARP